ncbi:hypothetical protein QGM71_11500 [Virgibacillus sp. C22-A2]|uniref:Transcriptional regulator n=1 Tax=Virgibacillus tibetensis TaxID=3042313 RepID=A0ABU6KFM3_9BACI|nr:hypothetical protein [Virgibacillus sp. C22-A2]
MKVKIAVFSREEILERIHDYLVEQDDIEIIPFTYTKASEADTLIDKAFMCDIYLFAGALPYLYAKEKIDKKRLPAVLVEFDEYMILTSLYRLRNHCMQSLNRFSVDVYNHQNVTAVFKELKIVDNEIYTYSFGDDETINLEKIISHHKKLWETGKIDYVLTSINDVEERLKELGIPCYCMIIPQLNIERAINEAKTISNLNQSKSAQIVAGFIRIKYLDKIREEKGELAVKEILLRLYQILLKFGHKTYASVMPNIDGQIVLFGTRGVLDHITNHYRDFPLLEDLEAALQTPIDIGFGLGLTAKQAEDNAKLALETCKQTNNSNCYIVNERQDIIGPLGVQKHFDTSRLYQALIHKARLNNELSYNFIDFITLRNNEPFSSNDIAIYYRVTKRSAERTISKLLTGDVIKVVGEEKPYVKGRPRKLFTLNQ